MVDDELDITFSVKTALEDSGLFQVDMFNESDIINKLGRDFFIPKPINNEDIIGRLKAILSENRQAFNGLTFAIIRYVL
jgi:hypothetical protein